MCTVSVVSANGKIIISSNRDEAVYRPKAIEPRNYLVNNKNIIFPKDPKAGGTWFAVDENGIVLVLLNGANEKHIHQPPYRKSRGLIVLDIISSLSPITFWYEIDLLEIEPFTIILFQNNQLFQLRWDGKNKDSIQLEVGINHIWSSTTLYSKDIRDNRSNLFDAFLNSKSIVSEKDMFHFHRYTEEGNQENGLVINRNETLKTLSITQAILEENKVEIVYNDLSINEEFETTFITI